MILHLDNTLAGYDLFLKVKALPHYRIVGSRAIVPDEYADRVGLSPPFADDGDYHPSDFLFDYQRDIAAMSIRKRKFSVFADCGLGKTLIFLEYARHVAQCLPSSRCILIVSPLMVIPQTRQEGVRWYGMDLRQVHAAELSGWMSSPDSRIGITNFEALTDEVPRGRLGCLIIDESSMLKSHYGKWGRTLLRLGRGLEWKWAGTGTPAPNDRIEYANHAVLMDAFPNVNAFLARFFVNKGQTSERWALKPHALRPFYRALSHWSIFLANPGVYGWRDHASDIPPVHVHVHDVPLTSEQRSASQELTGQLFATHAGGIGTRSKLGQIAKGSWQGRKIATNKIAFMRRMVDGWPDESTIIWCLYNREQDAVAKAFPEAANIDGGTPLNRRIALIDEFKTGRRKILVTKPRILGFGLNLQIASRQVFSGLQDSYESYYQAVKRSNRVGSVRPLHVHIPVTQIKRPMIETVLEKADRVTEDTREQEAIFREVAGDA